MIKINLAPIAELEIRFWYLPDVITFVSVGLVLYLGVYFYLDQIEKTIQTLDNQKSEFVRNTQNLGPDIERYVSLDKKIQLLHQKIEALKKITVSKITKYKPVIILEHLQNLKPEGLWFTHIADDTNNNIIRLSGGAFDNIVVAEFLAAVNATKFQPVDSALLRSQVFFTDSYLSKVSSADQELFQAEGPGDIVANAPKLTLTDPLLKKTLDNGKSEKTNALFPELKGTPSWQINLKYAERSVANDPIAPNISESDSSEKGLQREF